MAEKNKFKLIFLGSSGVGKTNIIKRLIGKNFIANSSATTGCSCSFKSFKLEGHSSNAELWDTIGIETHKHLTKLFFKDVKGIFVVYAITHKSSFDDVDEWINFFKESENSDVPIIIIGNRCDLKDKREVSVEQGELKAKKYGADFIETSALSGLNIDKAFKILIKKVIKIGVKEPLSNENKKLKIEYEKLQKDYETLKKNYDKLKDDNDKLNDELNKAKNIISNFEDKVKENINEINNLKNNIIQKDTKILNLKLNIKNIESFNKISFNNDDILYVHFISTDQNINCPIKCLKTDTFAEVEEKLYEKYQEYREINNNFVSKEKTIMRFKKIIENNINDGDIVELINLE